MREKMMSQAIGCAGMVLVTAAASFGQQAVESKEPAKEAAVPAETRAPEPALAGFGKITLDGLLQVWAQFDQGAAPESTFRLRRVEIKASGEIVPGVTWAVAIDPAQVLEDSKSTTFDGTNVVTGVGRKSALEDALISFALCKVVSVDVGQYKVPFGMEGLDSSAKLDFLERASMSSQFKWASARDIGATLKGNFSIGDMKIQPSVGVFDGEVQNTIDANKSKAIVGRLAFSPLPGVHVGAAHYNGGTGATDVENTRTGFEARIVKGPVTVYGEYAFGESAGKEKRTHYVAGTCMVKDDIQLAARYDWYDPDTAADDNAKTEVTLGVNYFIAKHNAKVQANYVFRLEEGEAIDDNLVRVGVQASY